MFKRALVAIAAAIGLTFISAPRAEAIIPDNLTHSFCLDFPLNSWRNNVVAYYLYQGYANVMAATDYVEAYHPTCGPETDVVFMIDTTIADWAGGTVCTVQDAVGTCASFDVHINPNNVTGPHDMIALGCHEVGHTLGLPDGPINGDDCMATGYTPSETLNQHHIDQANAR